MAILETLSLRTGATIFACRKQTHQNFGLRASQGSKTKTPGPLLS
jgi:hypothetical protein